MAGEGQAVWPGRSYPLGATWDGEGVNFALFSDHAERVELCLRRLREANADARERLLREAAQAVYAYFIQRELCGLRRHAEVIREYSIPREVLVRLGAS